MMRSHLRSFILIFLVFPFAVNGQLYPLSFEERTLAATQVVEGEVTGQVSFWNPQHTLIFTANRIKVTKLFKGSLLNEEIQVITQGGQVGNDMIEVSDLLQLKKGDRGIFLCSPLTYTVNSPLSLLKYDVYGSAQGFYRYTNDMQKAVTPFETIAIEALYDGLQQRYQQSFKTIGAQFKTGKQAATNATNKETATITGFSPLIVTAGTLNDPANNILTINGSNFGTPNGSNALLFKDADTNNETPTIVIASNSPYIVSWTNTEIKVKVPSKAASGRFAVLMAAGDTAYAPTPIDVFYAVLNAQFDLSGTPALREPRMMNANGQGGYNILYSTSTSGGGRDLSVAPEKATFERALTTWKEGIGLNFVVSGTSAAQTVAPNDKVNIVMFDNTNTGVPPLASGVLAVTYNGFSMCSNVTFEAQKVGFDIVIRNAGVSAGNTSFQSGPCFPSTSEIDLEAVLLHELGHALNLGHINDSYQASANNILTVNPAKLMHYSVLVYTNRRSLDQSALQGGIYCITPQNKQYGNCGLYASEMQPLSRISITNDECPGTFGTTPTIKGTAITYDLVHATSNKYKDPQFTAVNCNSTGTFITNNAYQTIRTNAAGTLTINISNYTTVPTDLASCTGQGIRLAIYQVNACPAGQQFPQPLLCRTITGNGAVTEITGLAANTDYLLFYEGQRNTKAVFTATYDGTALAIASNPNNPSQPSATADVYPNPVKGGTLNVRLKQLSTAGNYTAILYDNNGKRMMTATRALTLIANVMTINVRHLAAGQYHLVVLAPNGSEVVSTKVIKVTN